MMERYCTIHKIREETGLVVLHAQEKIRELEAELAELKRPKSIDERRTLVEALEARAEKAEAELVRLAEAGLTVPETRKEWREMKARAEKAEAAARTEAGAAQIHFEARQRLEARVAELEDIVRAWQGKLPEEIEAREREE